MEWLAGGRSALHLKISRYLICDVIKLRVIHWSHTDTISRCMCVSFQIQIHNVFIIFRSYLAGDEYLKPYVCSEPEVSVFKRTGSDDVLIIATDGLFDVVSNEVACDVVNRCLSGKLRRKQAEENRATEAAALLAELAIAKGSKDNISVIIVQMK